MMLNVTFILLMKKLKIQFLILSLILSFSSYAQIKIDSSILRRLDSLEEQIKSEKLRSEQLNKMSEYNVSNANNVMTYTNNVVAFFAILLTLWGITVGFFTIKNHKEIGETEAKVNVIKKGIEDKELKISNMLTSIQDREKRIEDDFNNLIEQRIKIENDFKYLNDRFDSESKKTLRLITLYDQAYDNLNYGRIKNAIKNFNLILEIEPNHYESICKLAMCYSSIDDNITALTKILPYTNAPESPAMVFSTYGVILCRLRKYTAALVQFNKAIASDFKTNHTTYSHIGYTYLLLKDYMNAIKYFDQSLLLNKHNSSASNGKLKATYLTDPLMVHRTLIDNALKNSKRDILENPKYPFPRFSLAFAEMVNDDIKCVNSLRSAMDLCQNVGILRELMFEYNIFKREDISLNYLNECIELVNNEINQLKTLYNGEYDI